MYVLILVRYGAGFNIVCGRGSWFWGVFGLFVGFRLVGGYYRVGE